MKVDAGRIHVTDDLGNDVVPTSQDDREFQALCAVAEAAESEHRAHCLLLTANCPLCKALDALDIIQRQKYQAEHN